MPRSPEAFRRPSPVLRDPGPGAARRRDPTPTPPTVTSSFRDVSATEDRDRRGRARAAGRWAAAVLVALVAGYLAVRGGSGEEEGRSDAAAAPVGPALQPSPPAEVVTRDILGRGEGLGELLRSLGLRGTAFTEAVRAVREHQSLRRLRPGVAVEVVARVPERVSRVVLDLDRDRSLHLTRREGGWSADLDSVPVTTDTIRIAGVVRSSLWEARLLGDTARLAPNEEHDILDRLSQIYAWQVDFFRDIRSGDAFRLLIERDLRPDGTIRRARVLAAEFFNDGRRLPAVRFDVPEGPVEYYDEDGEATRKAFLRAPLEFGRKTSGFSRRRFHPVLKRYRSHRGVDYGAPRGTPVMATGDGLVTRAGWWNGYGRVVEIRHNARHRTRYAHLHRITVQRGQRVEQKDVVGRVGATGLATGPHVHYEFLVNGTQRNPAQVDLPPGDPVPEAHRAEYREIRDARLSLLRDIELPPDVRLAHGIGTRSPASPPGEGTAASD